MNYSEEEKEAIDFFEKSFKKKIPPYWYDETISNIEEKIKTVLNLIQKQDKEIQTYKELMQYKSHKKKNNTMDYVKINKNNKFEANGICQDMRALKRTGKVKYRAYITFQGKQYTLGTHDSLEEAKKARANAEEKIKCIKEYFKKEVEKDIK